MHTSIATIRLTPAQFEALRRIIYERSGIRFPDARKHVLESRLGRRLAELGLDSYDHYIALLSLGPYQTDEFQEMFNRITINETSFFRNEAQLEAFEGRMLPELIRAREGTRRLRIWSAACSSGEEPFTIAMLLHRALGARLGDWRIEILGTDISEKVLSVANTGRYHPDSMRSTPEPLKRRYFTEIDGRFQLDDEIRALVTFERHNLRDRLAAKRHGTWDVIFCRNVMIYFDDDMKTRVASMFEEQLASDGYLLIGHSETLRGLETRFECVPLPRAFAYRLSGAIAGAWSR